MKAFFKTLFGDLHNLAFVAAVVVVAGLMAHFGASKDTVFAVPVLILAGAGWFATR